MQPDTTNMLAGVSAGSAATSLVAHALPWLQVIAILIAIVSGALSLYGKWRRRHGR